MVASAEETHARGVQPLRLTHEPPPPPARFTQPPPPPAPLIQDPPPPARLTQPAPPPPPRPLTQAAPPRPLTQPCASGGAINPPSAAPPIMIADQRPNRRRNAL